MATPAASGVVPAAGSTPAASTSDTALQITDIHDGPAKAAGLASGDVIVGVDGKRITSFEELRSALTAAKEKVSIDAYSPSAGKRTTRDVAVKDGTIGVSVVPMPVTLQ